MPLNCDVSTHPEAWIEDLPRILRELADIIQYPEFRLANAERLMRFAQAIIECEKGKSA
jgi:hypothetical protein